MNKITNRQLESITENMEEEEIIELAAKMLDFAQPSDANATLFLTMLHAEWSRKIGKRFVLKTVG